MYNTIAKRKLWQRQNKERLRIQQSQARKRARKEAIEKYGGKCLCCNEDKMEFLAVDHIAGNGTRHRKEIKKGGSNFFFWLRKYGYPTGYRILCHNCNQSLGYYGYCPHGTNLIDILEDDA